MNFAVGIHSWLLTIGKEDMQDFEKCFRFQF
jgi:hypothetical protein